MSGQTEIVVLSHFGRNGGIALVTEREREARQRASSDVLEDFFSPPLQLVLATALSPSKAFAAFPSSSRSFFVHFGFIPPRLPTNFKK